VGCRGLAPRALRAACRRARGPHCTALRSVQFGSSGIDRNCTESTKWTKDSDDHGAQRSAPEPPAYETGARPVELQGQVAPAEGVEPSRVRLTAGRPTVRPRWNDRDPARAGRRDDPRIGAATWRAASRTTRAIPLASQLIGAEFSRNRAPSRRSSPFVAFTSALRPPQTSVDFIQASWTPSTSVPSERGSLATRGRLRFRSLVHCVYDFVDLRGLRPASWTPSTSVPGAGFEPAFLG
jgi:hypothetical protein